MATYEKFLEYVSPSVAGATDPLMIRAIRDACIDFCVQSLFFVQALDPISSVAGIGDYDVETPDGTLVTKVKKLWYDINEIENITQDDLAKPDSLIAQYGIITTPGMPKRAFFVTNSSAGNPVLMLDPIPDLSNMNIVILAALKPARDSTSVFDQLYEDYAEAIGHGAVARLMRIKGAVFYDMVQSAIEDKAFRVGINDAMARANFGNIGSKQLRVKPVRI
jgi:hypothetical protein